MQKNEEELDYCIEVGFKRNKEGCHACKKEDGELYRNLCKSYKPCITGDCIEQYKHEFGTHVHGGMNTRVAKYAPKTDIIQNLFRLE